MGRSLGLILNARGHRVVSVVDRNAAKARQVRAVVNAEYGGSDPGRAVSAATMIFLAVADDGLYEAAEAVSRQWSGGRDIVAAHTSGLLGSEVLRPLALKGALIASFHPALSFTEQFKGGLDGVPVALEGEQKAVERLIRLVTDLGGKPWEIHPRDKSLYHLACTLASNGLIALLNASYRILDQVRSGKSQVRLLPLVASVIANIEGGGIEKAMTGPVSRGDYKTVEAHMDCLKKSDVAVKEIYCVLSRELLSMARRQGLDSGKAAVLDSLLMVD
jgi:predicted short-subunit dehydrogenase-like oxidoreductase (DUF2520 family)